ncbi:hypothetical protein WOLCODRAFT_138670 [Wolfiporia cocos MD-104 SS10]|uniref:Uncharacterized protein n=1 Tax=Wolfiporia cocos (strain MD-104) TaxID=742152 RepID=A0A2H3K4D7_WOLCO|nr:hypothetical protein WOLCODRAFT_138670 [Wolfiporia cocos MD-104 SS10]
MWEQVRAAAAAVLARSAAAKAAPAPHAKTAVSVPSAATDQPLTLAEPTATVPTPASAASKKKAARRTASEAAAQPVPLPSKVTATKSKAPAVAPPMPSSQSQAPDRPPPESVEASAEAEAWKAAYSVNASSDAEPDVAPPAPKEPGSTRRRKDKDAMTPCPVCRKVPFHYRYLCPVVLAGPEAIEVRLAELTSEGQRDRGLVESLKAHLAKARRAKKAKSVTIQVPRAMSDTAASAAERDESSSADEQGPAGAPPESTSTDADDATEEKAEMPVSTALSLPKLFAGSQIAEVSVETQDEGSSNDESDDSDEESDENDQESDENDEESDNDDDAILKNIDPETLLHGPYSRKSILDQLPSSDSSDHSADERNGSDVDAEEEEIELDRRYRRLSRRYEQASSTEDESDAAVEDNGQTYMDADPQDAVEQRDVNLSVAATLADSDERAELEGSATKVVAPVPDDRASDETGEDGVVPSSQPSEEQSVVQWQRSRLGSEDESNTGSRRVSSVAQDTVQVKQNAQLAQNGGHTTGSDAVANNVRSPSHTPEPAIVPVVTPAKSGKLINGGASAAANSSRKLVKKLSSKSDLAPETIDSSSLPVNNDETPAQTDPIETAEDPDPAAQSAVDDDPIQDADGFVTPPNERQLSPPMKTPKSGTIKRMKDRHGRLPEADIELPSLTPELAAAAQSTPAPTADDEAERRTTRMTTRRAASTAAMPPPPLPPALAAASKRRVRLTEEVKAERKAERERIAAEKKAAKEKEKAEKAAQKEAEKAARKGTAKARLQKAQTQEKKGSGKTQTAPSAADDDGSDIADVSNADTIVPTVRKAIPSATQGSPQSAPAGGQNASLLAQSESQPPMWTVLAQTPSMREESIDELQYPSSPALTSTGVDRLAAKNTLRAEDTDAREQGAQNNSDPFAFDQTQKQNGAATSSLQEKARPPGTASQGDVSTADPLFFPSSSQFPIALEDSQNSADGQDSDSDEDSEEELQLPKPTRVSRPWTAAAPFRRLSDLASQPLFSSALNTSMSFSLTPMPPKTAPGTAKKKVDDTSDDDDDDDEDETESDSDAQDRSHIPLGRRAGAGVQKKKKSGLGSFRY